MRISDWSSDVCSSDLQDLIVAGRALVLAQVVGVGLGIAFGAVGNRHGVARDGVVAAARPDGVVAGVGSPVVRLVVGLGRGPTVLIRRDGHGVAGHLVVAVAPGADVGDDLVVARLDLVIGVVLGPGIE